MGNQADLPEITKSRCELKCVLHYADLAQKAYNTGCYQLAIWAGEQSSANLDNLGESYEGLRFAPESIIARSYSALGRDNVIISSLKRAVKYTSIAIKNNYFWWPLKSLRIVQCSNIISANWMSITSFFCIYYILKDVIFVPVVVLPVYAIGLPYFIWVELVPHEEIVLSEETELIEQKQSFIWFQITAPYIINSLEEWINAIAVVMAVFGIVIYYTFLCIVCYSCRHFTLCYRCIRTGVIMLFIIFVILIFLGDDLI